MTEGGRFTGSTEDSGPRSTGNSTEDKNPDDQDDGDFDLTGPGYRDSVVVIGEVVNERWQ